MRTQLFSALVLTSIVIVLMTPSPAASGGTWGNPECFITRGHNVAYSLDYNGTARLLRAWFAPSPTSYYNIGLGALEMKFNMSHLPLIQYLQVVFINETIENPINMLKDYVYTDGTFNRGNKTHPDIVTCKYLLVYFYLSSDRSIINPWPMPDLVGAEWNYTSNITAPPRPTTALMQKSVLASTSSIQAVVPIIGYNGTAIFNNTVDVTTTTTIVEKPVLMFVAIFVIVVTAFCLVVSRLKPNK